MEIIRDRINIGARANGVSLLDIGVRANSLEHSDKIHLFERFIDRNPHLTGFNQYYRWASYSVSRNYSAVLISQELTDAMYNCTDLTI